MEHLFRFAYLDPGTGSMVIQSLIGVAAGVALFGRKAVRAVKDRLKGGDKMETAEKSDSKTVE